MSKPSKEARELADHLRHSALFSPNSKGEMPVDTEKGFIALSVVIQSALDAAVLPYQQQIESMNQTNAALVKKLNEMVEVLRDARYCMSCCCFDTPINRITKLLGG